MFIEPSLALIHHPDPSEWISPHPDEWISSKTSFHFGAVFIDGAGCKLEQVYFNSLALVLE